MLSIAKARECLTNPDEFSDEEMAILLAEMHNLAEISISLFLLNDEERKTIALIQG